MFDAKIDKVRTMCPMNCHPTQCGMLAEVNDGRLVGITGDHDNPDSHGFLCVRGRATGEIIGNRKRLLTPLIRERRSDDAWQESSWDNALDLVTERMELVGRESVGIWSGHGNLANNYGLFTNAQLLGRFANHYGCQNWNPQMICWGLGGFGLGLTGALETNTKEDMGENAAMILLWGANLVSQPNTVPHLVTAKKRGARLIAIDVRQTEATAQADEMILIRPGTDAALALAMMHTIIAEDYHDINFVNGHTVGFEELANHVRPFTPNWASEITGIDATRIRSLARLYGETKPAMIIIGGSSIHKGFNGWRAARAISCLPALTGNFGVYGGGIGPRHASSCHGGGFATITDRDKRPAGNYIPNQMSEISAAISDRLVRALILFGSNMLSSYADAENVAAGLDEAELVVTYDLFMNETSRRFADVVLPATAWLEDIGCKSTNTHIYLMEQALEPEGEAWPVQDVLKGLAARLGLNDFYPWVSQEDVISAVLDHPSTGHATVADLRSMAGIKALDVSHVAYPTHQYHTPSGKIEFSSVRAEEAGLPRLPVHEEIAVSKFPLVLCQGRTITQFHSFYDHGQALPSLAKHDLGAQLWLATGDAKARGLEDGSPIRVFNEHGEFAAWAFVTDRIPCGVVWMRDGCLGMNNVTSGTAALPIDAVDIFQFTVGQSKFDAMVDVGPVISSG